MPIYEYVCNKCGAHLEVMRKMSDAPLKRCKQCRGKLQKIISQSSFTLKGTGWYVTDYTGRSKSSSEKSEPASTESSSTAPKTDSKPAATKDQPEAGDGGKARETTTPLKRSK